MKTTTLSTDDMLTRVTERAIEEAFEQFKQETRPFALKRKAVQERLERLAKEAEKPEESVAAHR